MKNPLIAMLAIAVTVTLTQPANAQNSANGGYIGFSYGQTEADDACGSGPAFTVTSCDDKDNGLAIYGGYNFHENFAVEGGYIDFGESTSSATETSTPRASITNKNEAWSLFVAGVGKINVNEKVTLFGKAGLHRWTGETTFSSANSIEFDDDDIDLFYGVGGEVSLPDGRFKIRLEYQIFKIEDAFKGEALTLGNNAYQIGGSSNDIKFLSLGVTYAF